MKVNRWSRSPIKKRQPSVSVMSTDSVKNVDTGSENARICTKAIKGHIASYDGIT